MTGYGMRCCCKPVAAARFFVLWMFLAIVFDAPNLYFQLALIIDYEHYYYIPAAIINAYDIIILIPIVHWSLAAAIETNRKYKELGYPTEDSSSAGKVVPEVKVES